ncbi:hypothetical protein RUM43_010991 [Polyplax serrata]|uniref:Uncharacterized protein n=1 Tax=Polyplax serrata TaxID=468196 RepID=A0AAN8NSU0_POLSC
MGEIEVAGNYGEYACVDAAGEISEGCVVLSAGASQHQRKVSFSQRGFSLTRYPGTTPGACRSSAVPPSGNNSDREERQIK